MTSRVMIVEARFYEDIANLMMESVKAELDDAGATYECFRVPGTFELPGAIRMAIGAVEHRRTRRVERGASQRHHGGTVGL